MPRARVRDQLAIEGHIAAPSPPRQQQRPAEWNAPPRRLQQQGEQERDEPLWGPQEGWSARARGRSPAGVPLGMGPGIDRPAGRDDLKIGPQRGTSATHRRSGAGKWRATATTADQRPQGQDWRSSSASSHARCESMPWSAVSRPVGETGRLYETRKNLEQPAIELTRPCVG